MAITSAFQADDAGSIPAARSRISIPRKDSLLLNAQKLLPLILEQDH